MQAERLALAREWNENIAVNLQRAIAMACPATPRSACHFAEKIKAVTVRTTEIQKRYAEIETTPEGRAGQDKLADVRKRYLAQRETLFKARGDAARMASEGEVFKRLADEYNGTADEVVALPGQAPGADRRGGGRQHVAAALDGGRRHAGEHRARRRAGWRVAHSVTRPLQALRRTAQRRPAAT